MWLASYDFEFTLNFLPVPSSLPLLSIFPPLLLNVFFTFLDGQKCFIKFAFLFILGPCNIVTGGRLRIWDTSRKSD